MKRFMITGASGFIGKSVLDELIQTKNYEIYAVTTNRANLDEYSDSAHICEIDLFDECMVRSCIEEICPQYMLHLAWKLDGNDRFQVSEKNEQWAYASCRLIDVFYANGGERFLFASSSSEYGSSNHAWKEDESSEPFNYYGKCKRQVSEYGLETASFFRKEFLTLRYFSIYGKYDTREGRAIPSCINSFLKNEPVICNAPNNMWDYVYCEDAARITIKLLETSLCGIVNVASGKPVKMKDVFDLIARLMGCEDLLQYNVNNNEQIALFANNELMMQTIGYIELVPLEKGIRETISWNRGISPTGDQHEKSGDCYYNL